MKAEISSFGRLTIKPESETENFALMVWANTSFHHLSAYEKTEEISPDTFVVRNLFLEINGKPIGTEIDE